MKTQLLIAAIAAGIVATSASAQERQAPLSFDDFDTNGDGVIAADEFQSPQSMLFARMDTNGDGALTQEELEASGMERIAARASAAVERLDTNEDGAISEAEFSVTRRGPSPERMFDRLDADDSGDVSAEEFAEAQDKMRKMRGEGDRGKGHGPRGERG